MVHEILASVRNLGVLTTHSSEHRSGLTSRIVGVRFDARDERGRPDLRQAGITTNPQTRKAQQLTEDGRLVLTFLNTATEGYVVLYAHATPVADRQALWDSRFTPAMAKRAEGIYPCARQPPSRGPRAPEHPFFVLYLTLGVGVGLCLFFAAAGRRVGTSPPSPSTSAGSSSSTTTSATTAGAASG